MWNKISPFKARFARKSNLKIYQELSNVAHFGPTKVSDLVVPAPKKTYSYKLLTAQVLFTF